MKRPRRLISKAFNRSYLSRSGMRELRLTALLYLVRHEPPTLEELAEHMEIWPDLAWSVHYRMMELGLVHRNPYLVRNKARILISELGRAIATAEAA